MIQSSLTSHRVASIFVFVVSLAVYTATLSPYVLLEDDGLFILTSYFNGVAHPPGYPLYTLIGYIFSHFPVSTVAARVHFISAFFGAVSVLYIYRISFLLVGCIYSSVIASLIFAFSVEFWSQSVISEVYTLNSAIFFAVYYLVLAVLLRQTSGKIDSTGNTYLYMAAFLMGLGLANHWPLIVLSSVGLFVLMLPFIKSFIRLFPVLLVLLLLGLFPYLWMYFLGSNKDDFISHGWISNVNELFFYISRKGYESVDQSKTAGMYDKLQYIYFFLQEVSRQYTWPGILAVLIGIVIAFRKNRYVAISLVLSSFGGSVALILLLGFDFDGFHKILFMPYPLIAYGLIAVMISVFIHFVLQLPQSPLIKRLLKLFFVILPTLLLIKNYSLCDNSKNSWAEDFATIVLQALPANAILFVNGDVDTGPFGYVHYIQKVRPDVTLYQENGLLYPNRLYHHYRDWESRRRVLDLFIAKNNRPIFSTSFIDTSAPQTNMGLIYSINNQGDFPLLNNLNDWMLPQIIIGSHLTTWNELHKLKLLVAFIDFYEEKSMMAGLSSGQLSQITAHFELQVRYLDWLVGKIGKLDKRYYDYALAQIEPGMNEFLFKSAKALFLYNKAMILIKVKGQPEESIPLLEASVQLDPEPTNKAIKVLFDWYVVNKLHQKIDQLSRLTGIEFYYSKGSE